MSQDLRIANGPGEPGLVSVVIPTYNRAYILGRAIESILKQTYAPVEIVIADDGSTDDTHRLVERYGTRVRYFYQPNAGVSSARNLGLRNASGEFIGLLDSDDSWLPWKLEAQVRLMSRFPKLGMVWTDMAAVNESGAILDGSYLRTFYVAYQQVRTEEILGRSGNLADVWPDAPSELADRSFYTGNIFSPMILGNLVHTSTVLLRREPLRQVGGFDLSLGPAGEDYDFHLRMCRHGPVGFLDGSSIHYRVAAQDQLTAPHMMVHLARNNLRTVERSLIRHREQITLAEPKIRRRLSECHRWLGSEELKCGEATLARTHLWNSLRLWPIQPRTTALLLLSMLPKPAYRVVRQAQQIFHSFKKRTKSIHETKTDTNSYGTTKIEFGISRSPAQRPG